MAKTIRQLFESPEAKWSAGLLLGLLLVFSAASLRLLWPVQDNSICPNVSIPKPEATAEPVSASVPEGSMTSFRLGTDVNSGPRSVPFTLSAPIEPIKGTEEESRSVSVSAGVFASPTDGTQLPGDHLQVSASVDPTMARGFVTICIPPRARQAPPWGTFNGSVNFSDPRITAEPIDVTLSASYPQRQWVFLFWLGTCLLTSGYVFFLRDGHAAKKKGRTPSPNPGENSRLSTFLGRYIDYMTRIVGVLTIVSGLVAASLVFKSQYLDGSAWSADITQWAALFGSTAAAFVAGGTAGKLAGNVYATDTGQDEDAATQDADKAAAGAKGGG